MTLKAWPAGSTAPTTGTLLVHAAALVAGLVLSRMFFDYPFGDAISPVSYTILAMLIIMAFLALRPSTFVSLPVSLLLLAWSVPTLYSLAPGSSWAFVTWIPVIVATVLLSALSPAFLLAATGLTLVEFAGPMVILKHELTASHVSGSVPYFLGFVGAVAAILWQGIANTLVRNGIQSLIGASLASVMAASGVWLALASGSRAAVLGLAVGAVAGGVISVIHSWTRRRALRSTSALLLATVLLVPVLDIGLTRFFAPGATSTIVPVLTKRVAATQSELESTTGGSFKTRLEFWKQAGTALGARPFGHGPGSYSHVNHAYQEKPMVWSGSPHNFLALTAVETGVPGLLALLAVIALATYRALRWRPSRFAALIAAVVILSLDIFSSQPIQYLLWWAVIGAALAAGPKRAVPAEPTARVASRVLLGATLVLSSAAALRFALPCEADCDPIARYAGHPRALSAVLTDLQLDASDLRWEQWKKLYPFAFWLRHAHAATSLQEGDIVSYVELLMRFPYQSATNYVLVARTLSNVDLAGAVAACGLETFFSGDQIWRDHRSSAATLEEERDILEAIAKEGELEFDSPCDAEWGAGE